MVILRRFFMSRNDWPSVFFGVKNVAVIMRWEYQQDGHGGGGGQCMYFTLQLTFKTSSKINYRYCLKYPDLYIISFIDFRPTLYIFQEFLVSQFCFWERIIQSLHYWTFVILRMAAFKPVVSGTIRSCLINTIFFDNS